MNLETLIIKLHPASVHFPIALLLLASFTGLLYLYWPRLPILLTLTWPLLLLGWIGAIIACLTGLLAQSGLPPQAPYRSVLNWHTSTGLGQIVVYAVLLYQRWRYPNDDEETGKTDWFCYKNRRKSRTRKSRFARRCECHLVDCALATIGNGAGGCQRLEWGKAGL